jgi:hypothetical protein
VDSEMCVHKGNRGHIRAPSWRVGQKESLANSGASCHQDGSVGHVTMARQFTYRETESSAARKSSFADTGCLVGNVSK